MPTTNETGICFCKKPLAGKACDKFQTGQLYVYEHITGTNFYVVEDTTTEHKSVLKPTVFMQHFRMAA